MRATDLQFPSHLWDRIADSVKELVGGMICTDPSQRLTAEQVLGKSILFQKVFKFCGQLFLNVMSFHVSYLKCLLAGGER